MNKKQIEDLFEFAQNSPNNLRFNELAKLCDHYFGCARQNGTSHRIYKTPWPGDPRINIQEGENGKAKVYQVKQVLIGIVKLKEIEHGKS